MISMMPSLTHNPLILKHVIRPAVRCLSLADSSYREQVFSRDFPNYGHVIGDDRPVFDFSQLFTTIATHCYSIDRKDIVRCVLQETTRDEMWWSSKPLIQLVTPYVSCEASATGADVEAVLSNWYEVQMLILCSR